VEYQENEVRDLLALELPTKKKKRKKKRKKMNKGDTSTVQCFNCNELGHYANKCPEPKQPRGIDLVICQGCKQKGHCARRCPEKNLSKLP
jgi:heterodisulfide reductase subunit A-like polyferredoxin